MKKPPMLVLAALLPALVLVGCGSQPKKSEQTPAAGTEKASDLYKKSAGTEADNAMVTCPVSGHKVARDKAIVVNYEGKEVRLCCADCIEPFKSNPAKYMAAFEKGEGVGEVPESMK
jgi:YHS domain-containing protein